MATKGYDVKKQHLQSCTGHNRHIMSSVWNKPETVEIVYEVMNAYKQFCDDAEPGQLFNVVLYCTSGNHRSVAVELLLELILTFVQWAYGNKDNDNSIEIVHRSRQMGLWKRFCRQTCPNCRDTPDKKGWMWKEMMKVVNRINRSVYNW